MKLNCIKNDKKIIEVELLESEMEIYTLTEFKKTIDTHLNRGEKFFIFDLTKVEYIDSSGLEYFILIKKRLDRENGEIILYGARQGIIKMFEVTRLNRFFKLRDSKESAIETCVETQNIKK